MVQMSNCTKAATDVTWSSREETLSHSQAMMKKEKEKKHADAPPFTVLVSISTQGIRVLALRCIVSNFDRVDYPFITVEMLSMKLNASIMWLKEGRHS